MINVDLGEVKLLNKALITYACQGLMHDEEVTIGIELIGKIQGLEYDLMDLYTKEELEERGIEVSH